MRPLGGGVVALAVAVAIAASACVSAPSGTTNLRVLPGGATEGRQATPIPTQTSRPEPPIGVIFAGRVVLPCTYVRCTPKARLIALAPGATLASEPRVVPVATPIPLDAQTVAITGFGPTAREGSVLENEPRPVAAELAPGLYRVEIYTSIAPRLREVAPPRLACSLDFTLTPGQAITFDVAFPAAMAGSGCRIDLTTSFLTR